VPIVDLDFDEGRWFRGRFQSKLGRPSENDGAGIIAPWGLRHIEQLVAAIEDDKVALPELAWSILRLIVAQLNDMQAKVRQIEARLAQWHPWCKRARRFCGPGEQPSGNSKRSEARAGRIDRVYTKSLRI
jgi:hypothetical protein